MTTNCCFLLPFPRPTSQLPSRANSATYTCYNIRPRQAVSKAARMPHCTLLAVLGVTAQYNRSNGCCLLLAAPTAQAYLPAAQSSQLCNLLRWFDLIQHTAGAAAAGFQPVAVRLPAFVPLPPPAAAAPSSKPAASTAPSAASTATGQVGVTWLLPFHIPLCFVFLYILKNP